MASITFFLKEPTVDKPTPIIARLAHAGKKTKVYSGLSIHPRYWIQAGQVAKTRGYTPGGKLNDALAALRTRLEECFLEHVAAGTLPTPEQLREAIEPEAATASAPVMATGAEAAALPAQPLLWAAFEQWNDYQRSRFSPATVQTNITLLRHLRAYEAQAPEPLEVGSLLTPAFGTRFCRFLSTVQRLTDNSIAKNLTRLKAFLKFAHAFGFTDSVSFDGLRWQKQDPDILTLTAEEVQAVEEVALEGALANARDLFLLACYTGLRFSDLVNLRPEHLQGERLRLRVAKTREQLMIPLRPRARLLLSTLFAGQVHGISNQKLNAYLKQVGQRAGLDALVERTRYRAGRRESETFRKWELLTCHCGRRTFVTLALEQGLRPELVMRITGHRSFASFRRYVNITEQTVEREFLQVYGQ